MSWFSYAVCILVGLVLVALVVFFVCVECYDYPSQAVQPSTDSTAMSPPFDIDMVVTWVDFTDERRNIRRHRIRNQQYDTNDVYVSPPTNHIDEIKYLLRSVKTCAPWVRMVHLLTSDGQRPVWLDESCGWVRVVDDSTILPREALPSFNSHAIEANIHKIYGLAEHFLYSCDDMMFVKPVQWTDFFQHDGTPINAAEAPLEEYLVNAKQHEHHSAWKNNFTLLQSSSLYRTTSFYPTHMPASLTKTAMNMVHTQWPDEVYRTMMKQFRSHDDIHVVGLAQNMHPPTGDKRFLRMFDLRSTVTHTKVGRFLSCIRRPNPVVLCLGVKSASEGSQKWAERRLHAVRYPNAVDCESTGDM